MSIIGASPVWTGQTKTAQELAADYLIHQIRTGAFRPGQQIVPEFVAEEIGVSHIPVREAIRSLVGKETLVHRPRKGYFVAQLDSEDLECLVTLGNLLESEALRCVIDTVTNDQISRMQSTIDQSRILAGQDPFGVAAHSGTFHKVLFENGVPRMLMQHLDLLWGAMAPYRSLFYAVEHNQHSTCNEHEQILRAVEQRDLESALRHYDEHRKNISVVMQAFIAPEKKGTV